MRRRPHLTEEHGWLSISRDETHDLVRFGFADSPPECAARLSLQLLPMENQIYRLPRIGLYLGPDESVRDIASTHDFLLRFPKLEMLTAERP
jgi:hypothetical protein